MVRKQTAGILLLVVATSLLIGCVPTPAFREATNAPDYSKNPCGKCSEIQTGRTDCASIASFYVFFDAPADRAIESVMASVEWEGKVGTVPDTDIFDPSATVCNRQGWGVHVVPADIIPGFSPSAGDNRFVIKVRARYSGETEYSAPMTRTIFFLG